MIILKIQWIRVTK